MAFSVENSKHLDCYIEVVTSQSKEYIGHSHPFYCTIENVEDLIKKFEISIRHINDSDDY